MENDLISKQEALEDLSEPFTMSQCMTMEECEHMNFARALCIARIESIEPAQRWIPVTERLPREKHPVQVCYVGYNTGKVRSDMVACRHDCVWCYWEGEPVEECKVRITHWRELPEPPKEEP